MAKMTKMVKNGKMTKIVKNGKNDQNSLKKHNGQKLEK